MQTICIDAFTVKTKKKNVETNVQIHLQWIQPIKKTNSHFDTNIKHPTKTTSTSKTNL